MFFLCNTIKVFTLFLVVIRWWKAIKWFSYFTQTPFTLLHNPSSIVGSWSCPSFHSLALKLAHSLSWPHIIFHMIVIEGFWQIFMYSGLNVIFMCCWVYKWHANKSQPEWCFLIFFHLYNDKWFFDSMKNF